MSTCSSICPDWRPGTYKLKPEVKLLDPSLQVVTISPEQVEVVIKPEPTPTPTFET